jgi:altronate hydrolase
MTTHQEGLPATGGRSDALLAGLHVMPLAQCAITLKDGDDVAVTTRELLAGTRVLICGQVLALPGDVPRGHKIAVRDLAAGAAVHKYGQSIGCASAAIAAGDHVHTHNLGMDNTCRPYQFGTARTTLAAPAGPPRTFQGYRRANGRVGTRNVVAVLTSVNCSASAATMIADQFAGTSWTRSRTSTGWSR